jgi:hypothetical protein
MLPCPKDKFGYYFYFQNESSKQSNDPFFITDELRRVDKIFREMQLAYQVSATENHNGGFVKGPAMYVVTDDLILAPSSPISSLYLINHFETPLHDVKEKVVTIGIKEVRYIKNLKIYHIYFYIFVWFCV